MFSKNLRWTYPIILVLTLFSLSSVFAADPPKITLAPTWRPGSTLDSIDTSPLNTWNTGDDFRYVDVDIYVTTTVQFWSVQLTCTASPATLTSYESAAAVGDSNNTAEPIIWGPAWGTLNSDFIGVVDPYNLSTGARTFTASRLGTRYPMGGANGTRNIFLLATLRYRVKDIAANATATFTCTSTFLNRNGTPVLVATYTPPPPLPVVTGYVASGTALYQGRTSHAGITVSCNYWGDADPLKDFKVLTTATGAWTSTTRNQGYYTCEFYGDTVAPATLGYKPDRYIAASTAFELSGLSYNMLPVTLLGGNVNFSDAGFDDNNPNTADERIDINDIAKITLPANWNKTSPNGDVNGDGKTGQADLTLATSNYEMTEATDSRHIIYGIARDYDVWQHTRVWLGGAKTPVTTSMLATPVGEVRDMWPTVSPDGKQLAFIRNIVDGSAATPEMGLYTAPITNGIAGAPTLITPANADYMALAPSWSPDGTRIAFVCSWYDDGGVGDADDIPSGYLTDEGHLCVIDANNRNFRDFSQIFGVGEAAKTHIYPPTWASTSEIVFGGAWGNTACENTLCYANLQSNDFHILDADVLTGGVGPFKAADMPVIRGGMLFYRFYDQSNNTHVIRWADLTWGTPNVVAPFETRPGAFPFHMAVDFDADGSGPETTYWLINDSVDYFNVSTTGDNIIFYDSDSSEFQKAYLKSHDVLQAAEWWQPYGGWLDDMLFNPLNRYHTPYNPNDPNDTGSPFYAHRNTAEWLP